MKSSTPKKPETSDMVPEAPSAPLSDESVVVTEKSGEPAVAIKPPKEPNEAFFGGVLVFCLFLSFVAATGYFGLVGYRYFKQTKAEQAIPSIESLPRAEVTKIPEEKKPESVEKPVVPTVAEQPLVVDKKILAIKVLNGGAAKGVAGTFVEKLKVAGYIKTTVGNSFGNYTGQTLFYAKGQSAAADSIKAEIVKTFPGTITKEAPTGDKDATAATFVLILGK